jgi:hypothetical protein
MRNPAAHEAEWTTGEIGRNPHHAVVLVPERETEAWLLADPGALRRIRGAETGILPDDVAKEPDPERLLKKVMSPAGVDDPADYFGSLGEDISLAVLGTVPVYKRWCEGTMNALKGLRYL